MFKLKAGILADATYRNLVGRVLRENFRLYIPRYLLAFLLMGCAAAATGLSAYLMKNITAVVFGAPETVRHSTAAVSKATALGRAWFHGVGDFFATFFTSATPGMRQIFNVSVAIVLVFFIKGACQYGSSVILSKIGNNIVARQQHRVSNHILNQSLAFFVHFPSSDLITRVSQAASAARDVMNLLMMRVQDVFTAIALLITMFTLDWRLSCAALLIMAPVTLALGSLVKRIRKIATAEYQGIVQVISAIQEAIIGNKLIKSYNLEPHMSGRFSEAICAVEKRSNKMAIVSARTSPLMESMGGIAVASIVFYGGYRNLVHGESAGSLIAFLTALLLAYEPIKRIARMNVTLQGSLVGVQMLYHVLDSDYTIPDRPDARPIRIRQGDITLHHVTFSYRPGLPVIHDVSLACPGGHVTALVGPSGSGKSTLLNLIERFYSPDAGALEIDGQDLSQLTIASLRREISLVSQDTFLFSDTLCNNIRLARPEATDGEIQDAARAAFAHDFIMEQPQGYDTQVGENGGSLSGGQRQRISIARAFLKNAPILLLDEATSALDSESEQQIQRAFDRLMQNRTTIVIAHRFSTIRNACRIHVLQDGRLVASGSHQELIRDEDSLYAHLYRLQYQEAALAEVS
ncbi:MAG: ABC transporter ATP-binding protein [Verrucomicrobia bacterium]|nr:ABC transporter ATP-binding protein [Verrucomicrobiota bacterium]